MRSSQRVRWFSDSISMLSNLRHRGQQEAVANQIGSGFTLFFSFRLVFETVVVVAVLAASRCKCACEEMNVQYLIVNIIMRGGVHIT